MTQSYEKLLVRAAVEFPRCFSERQPKPLAVGIGAVLPLAWQDVPAKCVARFLAFYTGKRAYRLAVAAGGPRFYLDGSIDGEVTPADRDHARERLAEDEARAAAEFDMAQKAAQERRTLRKQAHKQAEFDAAIAAYREKRQARKREQHERTVAAYQASQAAKAQPSATQALEAPEPPKIETTAPVRPGKRPTLHLPAFGKARPPAGVASTTSRSL